mmetsp:Transcript_38491/g.28322  ORF Transcript_38491/g.28322 Transcript_38491/m.28322 type:complete len:90 (-) Transcript_38491:501-770(-)
MHRVASAVKTKKTTAFDINLDDEEKYHAADEMVCISALEYEIEVSNEKMQKATKAGDSSLASFFKEKIDSLAFTKDTIQSQCEMGIMSP